MVALRSAALLAALLLSSSFADASRAVSGSDSASATETEVSTLSF